MLQLRVFGPQTALAETGGRLEESGRIRNAWLGSTMTRQRGVLTADVLPDHATQVLEDLSRHGFAARDLSLVRLDDVGPGVPMGDTTTLIWADMIGQARRNARPIARYLAFMVAAGVIAAYGVVTVNATLIVGAMAVSPDTLPVTAACVGLVGRHGRLVGRALVTLALGLLVTSLAAAVVATVLDLSHRLPAGFTVGESNLSGLVTIGTGTIGVALASGVAGMLALETRASSAVGVAISVTTIPAAAYLGVAAALSAIGEAWGALAVLGMNVLMLLIGGTVTLLTQRWLANRAR